MIRFLVVPLLRVCVVVPQFLFDIPRSMITISMRWICFSALLIFMGLAEVAFPQTFTSIASFTGSGGNEPQSIVQGPDGNLWGTTTAGGNPGCGTIFKVSLAGKLTKALSLDCHNAGGPQPLTLNTDGKYYGMTFYGGTYDGGTVFSLSLKHKLTTLYDFAVEGSTGYEAEGNLVLGKDGNFYGTTVSGGSSPGYGVLFKTTPGGSLTTLYQFDFTHGAQPYTGPTQGTDGNFYGMTSAGGTHDKGVIYKMTPKGNLTVLYNFGGSAGAPSTPLTSLIQGTDGNFYGVTPYGGQYDAGTIFKITPKGTFTILHEFADTDGSWAGNIIQATDGNFYGTTGFGGSNGDGTIFQMTPSGTVTTLHSFDATDGKWALELIQDTNGIFYGVTFEGGAYEAGTVFSLATGLKPFIKTIPTTGSSGSAVIILGTELKDVTEVSFNGTPATFTVVSSSEIKATVPSSATSGMVEVTTGSGTLVSNVPFRVEK